MTGEWVGLFFLIKACSGTDHLTFEAGVTVISEKKISWRLINLARKYLAYNEAGVRVISEKNILAGNKENHFYSLPFGQAEASIY